jgi:hypothetical protein
MVSVPLLCPFCGSSDVGKMVFPMANNTTFAAIPSVPAKLFTQIIPTMVANPKSKNPSFNSLSTVQAFGRSPDVSVSVV